MTQALPDFYDEGALVAVLTAQPLEGPLDYLAPEGGVMAGAFVEVPLGPRRVLGVAAFYACSMSRRCGRKCRSFCAGRASIR